MSFFVAGAERPAVGRSTLRRGRIFIKPCFSFATPSALRKTKVLLTLCACPPSSNLVTVWLWSDREGVFSHQTALLLHQLSDVLPAQVNMTLPGSCRHRRFRLPDGVVLHFAELSKSERTWFGAVPVTTVARTLNDCSL
jgi:hypothetical protein